MTVPLTVTRTINAPLSKSSHLRCSIKKAVQKIFRNIYRKTPVLKSLLNNSLYSKETPKQMFYRKYCKISKKTYFEEYLRMAASVSPICFCPFLEELHPPLLANVLFQRYRFLKVLSDIDWWN